MSIQNVRLEVMQFLEKKIDHFMEEFLIPVEKIWQPTDLLPNSENENFIEEVTELREIAKDLPYDFWVTLVGDTITEEALPTYETWLMDVEGVTQKGENGDNGWAKWLRHWTGEENRHGDVLNKYLYLSGRVNMREVEITTHHLINDGFDIGTGNNGWGNNELQYYTDRPENIVIEDGMLKITARRELFLGSSYTSARILTKGKFEQKYGRIEARIKLPWGKGLWPAFWMLGANIDQVSWPQCGEIDIMEYLGNQPTKVFGTVHGPGYSGGSSVSQTFTLQSDRFDTDFHIFGIEWGENYINYYDNKNNQKEQ